MKLKSLAYLLALLLVVAPLAFSQSKATGAIVGTTLDEENTPLPGVTVTISSPNLMGTRTAVTGADGSFRFPALPPVIIRLQPSFQDSQQFAARMSESQPRSD